MCWLRDALQSKLGLGAEVVYDTTADSFCCRRTIMADSFISQYIEDLLKNIRTQVRMRDFHSVRHAPTNLSSSLVHHRNMVLILLVARRWCSN